MRALVELRGQGERAARAALPDRPPPPGRGRVAEALAAGQPPAQVRRSLRMPPKAAERFMADVAKRDVDAFRRALEVMADLELESRGGGTSGGALSEETQAVRRCWPRRRSARHRRHAGRAATGAGRGVRGALRGELLRRRAARDFLRAPEFCAARRA